MKCSKYLERHKVLLRTCTKGFTYTGTCTHTDTVSSLLWAYINSGSTPLARTSGGGTTEHVQVTAYNSYIILPLSPSAEGLQDTSMHTHTQPATTTSHSTALANTTGSLMHQPFGYTYNVAEMTSVTVDWYCHLALASYCLMNDCVRSNMTGT